MEKSIEASKVTRHGTVDFILRRMGRSKGFPAVSKNMAAINRKLSSKEKNFSASEIASLVLKDYALTTRLLKQVNSSFYASGRKPVTTVSRAVVLLGFEQVRLAATSLILFEHFRGSAGTNELKEAAVSSFMSGLFARKFSEKLKIDAEEASICAMLHNLGHHLVMLHLQKEHEEIKREMARKGLDGEAASRAILGQSYHELGMEIAKEWNFSDKIVKSMSPFGDEEVDKPQAESDILRGVSNFSNEICEILRRTPKSERDRAFRQVTRKFEKIVSLSSKQLQELLDSTAPEVKKLAGILNIPSSSFVQEMVSTIGVRDEKTGPEEAPSSPEADNTDSKESVSEVSYEKSAATDEAPYSGDQESIIINGIQEITNTLAEDYTFNDLIAMIVEIVYRGFAFDRAMFCMTSPKQPRITARFGLGNDINRFLGTFGFRVSKKGTDVFNMAVTQNLDFRIDDANAGPIKTRIPDWYRKTVNAPSFIIYPIFIDNVCLGFLYADREEEGDPIPDNQLNYMRTLRNQLVIGIKQKRMRM
ncbi:MAG: HDOD domain-containing protein [Deltaproteobacteria bacterium]|nr:HDOD domain-containing protein [Deltaproteobacteria bacterium]